DDDELAIELGGKRRQVAGSQQGRDGNLQEIADIALSPRHRDHAGWRPALLRPNRTAISQAQTPGAVGEIGVLDVAGNRPSEPHDGGYPAGSEAESLVHAPMPITSYREIAAQTPGAEPRIPESSSGCVRRFTMGRIVICCSSDVDLQ